MLLDNYIDPPFQKFNTYLVYYEIEQTPDSFVTGKTMHAHKHTVKLIETVYFPFGGSTKQKQTTYLYILYIVIFAISMNYY